MLLTEFAATSSLFAVLLTKFAATYTAAHTVRSNRFAFCGAAHRVCSNEDYVVVHSVFCSRELRERQCNAAHIVRSNEFAFCGAAHRVRSNEFVATGSQQWFFSQIIHSILVFLTLKQFIVIDN